MAVGQPPGVGPLLVVEAQVRGEVAFVAWRKSSHARMGLIEIDGRGWMIAAFLAVGFKVLPAYVVRALLQRLTAQSASIIHAEPIVTIPMAQAVLQKDMSLTAG